VNRPWHIWSAFAACFAVLLTTGIWLTVTVLRLERSEAQARQQAALEETVRLALWRMESALAPLVARESARPYFVYNAFYPAERAYTRMFSEIQYGDVLVPSPLLSQTSPYILVHFQIDPDGAFTSPQVPPSKLRALSAPGYTTAAAVDTAAAHLGELRARIDRPALVARLPLELPRQDALVRMPPPQQAQRFVPQAQQEGGNLLQQGELAQQQQATLNLRELQARSRNLQQTMSPDNTGNDVRWSTNALECPLQPVWCNGLLLLARRVIVDGDEYVQGCWLDWPATQQRLAGEVADLLPDVRLMPHTGASTNGEARVLATLPVRVDPGLTPAMLQLDGSPLRVFLLVAWIGVVLAGSAVITLLFGTVSLSERRASFVSAVTHELRTPLTTFRLYTDLLLGGQLTDPTKRHRYLATLHAEAVRLAHLVENVLAYARLEHGRNGARVEEILLGELVGAARERLAERAAQAEMTLTCEPAAPDLENLCVRAARATVDQILFNLVDNACKYATSEPRKEIAITLARGARGALIRVRDAGPGVPAEERARLFRPFHKSAREAAHSAPGVGLGLALSRRLARSMGGDLRLVHDGRPGACFELDLRTAPAVAT